MPAEGGETLPTMTPLELRTRKRFVGLDLAATKALQALRPWMEAHVQEVVEEFYAHLLRFQQPPWLLADAQVLERVKAAQTDYLRSLTEGTFDMAYVANRLAIGRTHARVGVTPQWYMGTYSIFARLLFPRILEHYRDRPLTGVAAVKALIAAMHLDMQLAIDAYLEASQEALQHQATSLEEEVSLQTSALQERARDVSGGPRGVSCTSHRLGDHRPHAAHRRWYGHPGVCACPSAPGQGHRHDRVRLGSHTSTGAHPGRPGFLSKPFSSQALLDLLARQDRSRPAPSATGQC